MLNNMKKSGYAIPAEVRPDEIRYLRERFRMTQRQLSALLGCSVPTVQRWEESSENIVGPAAMLLHLLSINPELLENYSIPERTTPLRMWYMHMQQPCTVIDVDMTRQRVKIKNYTDNVQFRAFGRIEKPTYAEFESFLKSRCFPETRDKMKLMLREIGVPFYDPMLIISKTQGRMAEDDFWIKMEGPND